MAQYNADIRIGVTGKTQLNQLEAQLKRTQTQLNKLNKSLKLRAKVQAIKLDTRAANTAVKQLEQRINRLGRTITLNVRTNQKEGRRSGGGSSVAVVSNPAKELAVAKALRPVAVALTNEAQKQLDLERARATAINKLVDNKQKEAEAQKRLSKAIGQQEKLKASKNNVTAANLFGAGSTRESGLKKIGAEIRNAQTSLRNLGQIQTRFKTEVVNTSRAYQQLTGDINRSEQAASSAAAKASQRKRTLQGARKGAAAGAGIAALSIPGIGDAAGGALAGAAVGGKAGAIAGGAVGLTVALVKGFASAVSEVTKFNNQLNLSKKALANTVSTTDELEQALTGVDNISKDFLVPIGDATKQFTKLNAAARASGFEVGEVEDVYRGLASANVALGGDAERLNGILLATQQVFSKGKVQAEELRGQIGERLAGAFAKFAESAGLSTSELDKALEKGEVSLTQFIAFSKSLLEEYEEDAKKLADAPENAAQRLKLALDDLKKAAGPILQDIGNAFTTLANDAVKALTKMFKNINAFIAKSRVGAAKAVFEGLKNNAVNLQRRKNEIDNDPTQRGDKFGQTSDEEYADLIKNLGDASTAADNAFKSLQAIKNPLGDLLPSGNPLKPKEEPDLDKPTGNGSGSSKSGPTDNTADLRIALDLQTRLNALQLETVIGNERVVEKNQQELEIKRLLLESDAERQRIALENTTAESKELANLVRKAELTGELNALAAEQAQTEFDRNKELRTTLRGLQEQIDIEGALTDEAQVEFEWKARIAELDADGTKTAKEKAQIEAKINELYSQRLVLLDPVVKLQRDLEKSLGDTRGKIASLAQTVTSELGTALSSAITGLIDGTTTVEQAFSSMFANIGKAFIDMATQMLAQKAVLSLLSAFGGGGGGGGGAPDIFSQIAGRGGLRANGGPVNENTPYIVGERGPELFIPGASGSISNNDQFEAARDAMSGGGSGSSEAFSENAGALAVSNSYTRERTLERENNERSTSSGTMLVETQVINNVEYVSKEQLEVATAASAKQARAQVFNDMRNRPSTRRQLGIK